MIFFAEGTVEIGSTSLIDIDSLGDGEGANFTNEQWNFSREVMVKWPAAANNSNTGIAGNKPTPKYVALVVCFAGKFVFIVFFKKNATLSRKSFCPATTFSRIFSKRNMSFEYLTVINS